jgi:D-lactate dehydrogenase (cytochrome)
MRAVKAAGPDFVTVQGGVTLREIQAGLAPHGSFYPPVPTFDGACAAGVVATNAAGAATFKYGTTRRWVQHLTVVLASGDVLELERGVHRAHPEGFFHIHGSSGTVRVPIPGYRVPAVPKCSAGYFAEPEMDPIDLFIGSEGTLGLIVEVTFRAARRISNTILLLVSTTAETEAFELADELRQASWRTWQSRDPRGIDVAAIEYLDRRSIAIVREDGVDRREDVTFDRTAEAALLVQLDVPADIGPAQAYDQVAGALRGGAPDTPLVRCCRLLSRRGLLDATEMAVPGDLRRAAQFFAVREAVALGVNQRVGLAKRADARIEKTAADMIAPIGEFAASMRLYRKAFRDRGLDHAIWGHISDGNVHPNVIPRSWEDVLSGREAIRELGREITRMGGSPLAEHGVGRSPVKQDLLRGLYGEEGIEAMRRVKRALDPAWRLAPGVLFPR